MKHIYIEKDLKQPLFVLLHGTGGTEEDLLPVAQLLNDQYNVLSLRGRVSEHGANRFFKRLAEGVYDEVDLHEQSDDIVQFLKQFCAEKQIDLQSIVFVGFSNGANMIMHLLLHNSNLFQKGVLFAPMYPLQFVTKNLSDTHVFLSMGTADPIVPIQQSEYVMHHFVSNGATVTPFWVQSHQITMPSIQAAKEWLQTNRHENNNN